VKGARRISRSRAVVSAAACAALLAGAPASAGVHHPDPPVSRAAYDERVDLTGLRDLYLRSVREAAAIREGLGEIERLRASARVREGTEVDATLDAYRGALITLRAKHAAWPPDKLRHLNRGLAVLDATVRAHPDHAEARYLRLMSCYYLPGILGRGRSVRDDFAALARLLPGVRDQYPRELYGAIARFVVDRGRLPADDVRALQATLARGDD